MTVSNQKSKVEYTANGTSKNFEVPFYFIRKKDLVVYRKIGEAPKELLKQDIDYSVSGSAADKQSETRYPNGGTVVLAEMPLNGTKITIMRVVELTQLTDYQEAGTFPAELHEQALDKLTMQIQQLAEEIDRAVKIDVFSESQPSELIDKVESLYEIKEYLVALSNDIAVINTVAGAEAELLALHGKLAELVAVYGKLPQVQTVSDAVNDVVLCAAEIAAIKDAPTYAADAHASMAVAVLAEASAADSRDKAAASESSAVVSRDKAAASENKAREYALQAVRRNVGDVFYTTRSDDALNGAVEADGAVYQCADFAGENAVPALLAAGKLPYVSMAEYDELLRSDPLNGVCHECVVSDGGLISARSGGWFKPTLSDIPFSVAESWEFETRLIYKNFGGATWRAILATGDPVDFKNPFLQISTGGVVCAWLSSNGTSWNLANQVNTGLTLADGTEYRLKFGFDGATYYLKYKTPTDADFVTKWSLAKTDKIVNAPSIALLNTLSSASLASTYWNGSQMSLPDTALTVDGVEVWRGGTGKEGALSCRVFGWDGAGATAFRVPKAEKPKRVLVAEKKPSADSQNWWELYSDGWLVQGGYSAANSVHEFCRLEKPYRDAAYTVVTVSEGGPADYMWSGVSATPKTVDSFQFSHRYAGRYVAYGYAAVPPESEWQFQNVETHRAMVQLVTGATDDAVATATGVLPRMNRLEQRFQIVSALPENPDPETFYFVVKGD